MPHVSPSSASLDAWRGARDYGGLCALGARFCRGEIATFPGWLAGSLDEESRPLEHLLAAWNERGFLTLASQPGREPFRAHDGVMCRQRAFVTGFANESALDRVLTARQELEIRVFRFDAELGEPVAVSERGAEACVFTGHNARGEELDIFREHVGEDAWRELAEQTYVSVLDTAWTRATFLFERIEACWSAP